MASLASARLRHRLAALDQAAQDKVKDRQELRDKARAAASIAAALAQRPEIGVAIAAGEIGGAWYYAGAARLLSELGDNPDVCQADAAFIAADPKLAARQMEEAALLAEWTARYTKGDPPPQPGASSPFAWYAWAVAQQNDT